MLLYVLLVNKFILDIISVLECVLTSYSSYQLPCIYNLIKIEFYRQNASFSNCVNTKIPH